MERERGLSLGVRVGRVLFWIGDCFGRVRCVCNGTLFHKVAALFYKGSSLFYKPAALFQKVQVHLESMAGLFYRIDGFFGRVAFFLLSVVVLFFNPVGVFKIVDDVFHCRMPNFKKRGRFIKKGGHFMKKSSHFCEGQGHYRKEDGAVCLFCGRAKQKEWIDMKKSSAIVKFWQAYLFFLPSFIIFFLTFFPSAVCSVTIFVILSLFGGRLCRLYILFPRFCLETKGGAKNSSPFDADQFFMREVFRRMGDRTTPKSDGTHILILFRYFPSYACVAMEPDVYCAEFFLGKRARVLKAFVGKMRR